MDSGISALKIPRGVGERQLAPQVGLAGKFYKRCGKIGKFKREFFIMAHLNLRNFMLLLSPVFYY